MFNWSIKQIVCVAHRRNEKTADSVFVSVCMSVSLFLFLSLSLFPLSISVLNCQSVFLTLLVLFCSDHIPSLCLSVCLSVYLSIYVSICPSFHPSIPLCVYPLIRSPNP